MSAERAMPVEPVRVVPEAMTVVVAALRVMLVPGVMAATVAPVGTFVPVIGMPMYQPAVLPVKGTTVPTAVWAAVVTSVGAVRRTSVTVVFAGMPIPVTVWPTPMAPAAGAVVGMNRRAEGTAAVAVKATGATPRVREPAPSLVRANAPETAPPRVRLLAATVTVRAAGRATGPTIVKELVPAKLRLLVSVRALATETPAAEASRATPAPLRTIAPVEAARLLPRASVPAVTVVPPL